MLPLTACWLGQSSERHFVFSRQTQRQHQTLGSVAVWMGGAPLELLDPVDAQSCALSYRFLGQPSCHAMLSEEFPKGSSRHR